MLPRSPARHGLALLPALALLAATSAGAQVTEPDEICNPASDPCVIAAAVTVEAGAFLDFGERTLRITASGRLISLTGDVTIFCRQLQMDASSQINLSGTASDSGGSLDVSASDSVSIAGTVNVAASAGPGNVTITATRFELPAAGRMLLNGGSESDGGGLSIAAEEIAIAGQIQLNGGSFSTGGDALFEAASSFSLSGLISATGGDGGGGAVTIESGGLLTVTSTGVVRLDGSNGGSGGEMTLAAGDFLPDVAADNLFMQGTLSAIGGNSTDGGGDGGAIDIAASRGCQFAGRIQVQSGSDAIGGPVTISCGDTLRVSDIVMATDIDARGLGTSGEGGEVSLVGSSGSVTVSNGINASGGNEGSGGTVAIEAGSSFTLSALISATGGEGGGGAVTIGSEGLLTVTSTGVVRLDGSNGGSGGEMTLAAGDSLPDVAADNLFMQGTLSAIGGNSPDGGGDGGGIAIVASRGCQFAGRIQAQSGSDGSGGPVTISCGDTLRVSDIVMATDIDARGTGTSGDGGEVSLEASSGSVTVSNRINASGGTQGRGGTVAIEAAASITLSERVTASGAAGEVSLATSRTGVSAIALAQTGSISADGTGSANQGGSVSLDSCRVQIASRGGTNQSITALGPQGSILVTGVRQIEIAGRMTAGPSPGTIELIYRDVLPFIEATASFNPGPIVVVDASLLGCDTPIATRTPTSADTAPTATQTALLVTPTPTPPSAPTATGGGRSTPTSTLTRTPTGTPTPLPTPAGPGDKNCNGILEPDETAGVIRSIFDAPFAEVCPNVTNDATVADLLQYLADLAAISTADD